MAQVIVRLLDGRTQHVAITRSYPRKMDSPVEPLRRVLAGKVFDCINRPIEIADRIHPQSLHEGDGVWFVDFFVCPVPHPDDKLALEVYAARSQDPAYQEVNADVVSTWCEVCGWKIPARSLDAIPSDAAAPVDPIAEVEALLAVKSKQNAKLFRYLADRDSKRATFEEIAIGMYNVQRPVSWRRRETARTRYLRLKEALDVAGMKFRVRANDNGCEILVVS